MSEIATPTATFVKTAASMRGDARVYKLEPPFEGHDFVVSSAIDLNLGINVPDYRDSETYIFPSDGDKVTDWGELAGVPYKSHEDALRELGYEVAK